MVSGCRMLPPRQFPHGEDMHLKMYASIILSRSKMENGLRPSLLVGVPVGFVNVEESKERIIDVAERYDIPVIVARGKKGGSNVAAAVCNALLYLRDMQGQSVC